MRNPVDIRRFVLALGALCVLSGSVHFALAGDDKPQSIKLEVEKLALFKNGLGFVVAGGVLPGDAQTVRIGQLPVPTFGTFWIGYPKDVKLQSAVTSMEDLESRDPVQSIGQLLQMNAGRKVVVHTADRDIEGVVLAAPASGEAPETPSPYLMSPLQPRNPIDPYLVPHSPDNVLLMRTDKGIVALSPASILRAEFADGEPVSTVPHTQKRPSISLKLDKPGGGEKITVSYLAHGVTWVPGYLIDLTEPGSARFNAHAIIINEMMDMNNVKIQLVTGFPNIKFSGISNPMARSQSLADLLQALSGAGGRQDAGDYRMTQQAVMVNVMDVYGREASELVPGYATATEGEAAEDLYFYPARTLSLKRNETVWIPLFTAEMPYKHIYTWRIRDFVDSEDHYQAEQEGQDRKAGEEIWHSCRLTNVLAMPLTTAAAQFVANGEFTGQDVCYYTAPKSETTIRINKALNLLAEQAEIEVDRKREASLFHGYRYDLVRVRGELKLRNRLGRQVTVEITKGLSGEVLESAPRATDTKTAAGLKKVNPKHVLTWLIDLKADEEQKISYQYQVYIRD